MLIVGVAFPVRAGDAQKFKRFDLSGVRNVRAAAEIDEFALSVKAEFTVLGQAGFDVFALEFLLEVAAELQSLFAVHVEAFERLGFFDDLLHLSFDLREVFLADRSFQIEVVVKACAGRRAERQADAFIKPHDRSSHDVSTRVTEHSQSRCIASCD